MKSADVQNFDTSNELWVPISGAPQPGRVVSKDPSDGVYKPVIKDAVGSNISGTTSIPVSNTQQFESDQWVELPGSSQNGAIAFRKITNVDHGNGEIDVNGANLNLSQGDDVIVDPSRAHDAAQSASSGTQISVADEAKFSAGQIVHVGDPKYTLVLDVTGSPDGDYEVMLRFTYFRGGSQPGLRHDTYLARYTASSDGAGTIAGAIQSDLDEYNGVSASVQNTSEVHVDLSSLASLHDSSGGLAKPNFRFEFIDPNSELVALPAKYDITIWNDITSTGSGVLNTSYRMDWSSGDQIVTEPGSSHGIVKSVNGSRAKLSLFEVVDKSTIKGLTSKAEDVLGDKPVYLES